jgi:hypothetical protein
MALTDQSTRIRSGEELDASLIDPYLKAHIPGLSGLPQISQFPGGASNLTYLLEYPEQEFVLRRPPFGHKAKSAHDMGREYRILNQLKDGFPYCPNPYVHGTDDAVIGAEFYVMERVNGIILRSELPPELGLDPAKTEALCKSFIDKFVELHRVDYNAYGLGDLGKPEGYVARQIKGWSDRYEKARCNVTLVMRLREQEKLPINGVAQFRQVPVAELRQQHHPVGFQVIDDPRTPRDQLVCPAILRLMRHKADFSLFELGSQQRRIENFHFGGHHLGQQLLKTQPHRAFFFLVVTVPVNHFMVETLAATAHQVTIDSGAKADAGGLDGLIGHK